jgi:hypothetical protein
MFPGPNYAQILRAIGQDLEASKLRYFEPRQGEDHLVRSATSTECEATQVLPPFPTGFYPCNFGSCSVAARLEQRRQHRPSGGVL